jgi:hypothetical protein
MNDARLRVSDSRVNCASGGERADHAPLAKIKRPALKTGIMASQID